IRYTSAIKKIVYNAQTRPIENQRSPVVNAEFATPTGNTSKIAQGCLPYSAKNQPDSIATHGNGRPKSNALSKNLFVPTVFLIFATNAPMRRSSNKPPANIIIRNDQKVGPTSGIVSAAACFICSSVASTTLSV